VTHRLAGHPIVEECHDVFLIRLGHWRIDQVAVSFTAVARSPPCMCTFMYPYLSRDVHRRSIRPDVPVIAPSHLQGCRLPSDPGSCGSCSWLIRTSARSVCVLLRSPRLRPLPLLLAMLARCGVLLACSALTRFLPSAAGTKAIARTELWHHLQPLRLVIVSVLAFCACVRRQRRAAA
jgi:hypothetical protein